MRKPPKYRKHSQRDFGFVEFEGERQRFPGRYNSTESIAAYQAFLRKHRFAQPGEPSPTSLADVLLAYLNHALAYYGAGPRSTGQAVRHSIKLLINREPIGFGLGRIAADQFGPMQLKEWRQWLINRGMSRVTVNQHVGRIKRGIRWCVSEELVPVAIYQALTTVDGLAKGRSDAPDLPPRQPTTWAAVDATLHHLTDPPATMLYLQWLTGVRSGSLCQAKPAQFRQDGQLLLWRPPHKTQWKGKELVVPIGPVGQMCLARFLDRDADAYLFDPRQGKRGTNRRYTDHYKSWTYRKRIARTQERFSLPVFTPHQLRHARAQMVRDQFGIEAAQAALGHDTIQATQLYSTRRLELAKEVALKCG